MDILLNRDNDLAISKRDLNEDLSDDRFSYDVLISGSEDVITNLFKRALKTPITYIGLDVIDNRGSFKADIEYGNALYIELSEPLTYTWLERAKSHINRALSFVPKEIKIISNDIRMLEPGWVRIDIIYEIDGIEKQANTVISVDELNDVTL
jgi:hypothetical protein